MFILLWTVHANFKLSGLLVSNVKFCALFSRFLVYCEIDILDSNFYPTWQKNSYTDVLWLLYVLLLIGILQLGYIWNLARIHVWTCNFRSFVLQRNLIFKHFHIVLSCCLIADTFNINEASSLSEKLEHVDYFFN